jgi:anaerobic magnesium-protoporphyrin IX monomethyl ester cyclase
MFLDDELNVNPEFLNLLDGLQRLQSSIGVDFRFRGLLKSELVTPEMAEKMYRTGFRQILVGFESGSPRMLLNMNKHATRDDNTRCVETLRNAGIKVKALMSLGHPGESPETVIDTANWLLDVKPDDFDVTIITVYPGTPYFDDAISADLVSDVYLYTSPVTGDTLYSHHTNHLKDINFYKGIPGQYQSFVWTDTLSRTELVSWRDAVEREVREALQIPWPTAPAATQFEHSMGMR